MKNEVVFKNKIVPMKHMKIMKKKNKKPQRTQRFESKAIQMFKL